MYIEFFQALEQEKKERDKRKQFEEIEDCLPIFYSFSQRRNFEWLKIRLFSELTPEPRLWDMDLFMCRKIN